MVWNLVRRRAEDVNGGSSFSNDLLEKKFQKKLFYFSAGQFKGQPS